MCIKCLRFGHISVQCRSGVRCGRCGSMELHTEVKPCPNANSTSKCANCGGDHAPSHIKCPDYLFQEELQVSFTKYKLPFKDTKSILRSGKEAEYASSTSSQANSSPTFSFLMFPELKDASNHFYSDPRP